MKFVIERPIFKEDVYNIIDFGAKSDVSFNNQKAIQNAIDECNKNGGGMVLIPAGYYLTGPIEIKSNVNLHVCEGAYVQFTKSKEEYPLIFTEYEGIRRIRAISPIRAYEANNIAITGRGVMDGAGLIQSLWIVTPHLRLRLGDAEEVGAQLLASHVIQNLFLEGKPLSGMDIRDA